MDKAPLSGFVVFEYADFISGPSCTRLMANVGATVIKIEEPGIGDSSRHYGPFPQNIPDPEASGLFLYLNTNKSGITLDLHTSTGRDLFERLVKRCDVFVHNHHPADIRRLGLSYTRLRKINPGLVYTSITCFGLSGPNRNLKGNNLIAWNMGGMASFTPDWVEDHEKMPPLQSGGHQADFAAGLAGALATLGALYGRQASGKGCLIDISEQEAVTFALARSTAFYTYEGVRQDRKKPKRSMESPIPCKDGYVETHCVEDAHWLALRRVIGDPEWAASPKFATYVDRCNNWKELEENISEWTMKHTKQEIYHMMQAQRVAFGPVNIARDIIESAHMSHRGYFMEVDHPRLGKLKIPGLPFKMSESPSSPTHPAPRLGEHNYPVYSEMLGISARELVTLKKDGII